MLKLSIFASRFAMLYILLCCCLLYGTGAYWSRFDFYDDFYTQLFENDPNLNPDFDIEAFRDHQLYLHNYYRYKHRVPLMTMDNTLTQQAQEYAEELALNDAGLIHCFNVEGCDMHGAGENLASAEGYTNVEANATVIWYNEIWDYNFCTTGVEDRNRPGHEGKAIGHFTQIVWETSLLLGVGYARTSDRFKVYVVARYAPYGNVIGQYRYVPLPEYALDKFQHNCNGINGGLSDWVSPGSCTRSCGGGVRFLTKTCTDPKPSLNGRDCEGVAKNLIKQWCNTHVCSGDLSHRDLQCAARREMADAHNFGATRDCLLHCRISSTHFVLVGEVDDGTHCNKSSGACVSGVCHDMPDYVVGTQPPTTTTGVTSVVIGSTTKEPETTSVVIGTTTEEPGIATTKQPTIISAATTTEPETTKPTPSPTPATRLVTGAFDEILRVRYERLFTITSGATDIIIHNCKPRNARISVRFQIGNRKPTRFKKKYGVEMFPFAEQLGKGSNSIITMVSIEGPIKPGFKVLIYIHRRRRGTTCVTWHYWV